ncbi:MAG: NAD-dependent epimerase/dehydratase family protein [Ignavibacteria bacterium]|nr:NAD-dependent epimerase/dehydratase family protein [Ignavibacteria bacterium]
MQKCIIYGGAGFIGSYIAEVLLKNNISVTIFDKKNCSKKNINHIFDNITFVEGDFNNKIDIYESSQGHDYVVHLVSSTLPADSNLNPSYDIESNLLSSLNLFDCCVKHKIKKIIFISSGGTVYGNSVKIPIKETHPTNPLTSYGIIKLTIEKYLGLYNHLYGLDYKILRFANPFGPRQNPKLNQGLIAHMLYRIKNRQPLEIWGDGKNIRDYFSVKDAARAVRLAIEDKSPNRIYNIGSGKGLSVNQVILKFRQILNLNFRVKYVPSRKFDVKRNVLDISLARKCLKWKPIENFNIELENTWKYILDNE